MKASLFDLGNVVVRVDFNPFLDWLSERSASADREKVQKLLSSSLFFDFEFGNLSSQEFSERLRKLYGAKFTQQELEHQFCQIFPEMMPGMEDLLSALAKEGAIYCLSNTNKIHLDYCKERFPVLNKFTKIFASHEMRMRKPYPGIYRDVVNELGMPASHMIFFDDLKANVEGARRAGLIAHVFESAESACELVKNFREMGDRESAGGANEGIS